MTGTETVREAARRGVRKAARMTAFEETVTAAGEVLKAELADAGTDNAARRAAWARYGDVQDAAGAAYRAAQAADQ